VTEHCKVQQAAAAAKIADLAAAVADVDAHEQEQAVKEAAAKRAAERVKQEQQQQVRFDSGNWYTQCTWYRLYQGSALLVGWNLLLVLSGGESGVAPASKPLAVPQ
jgi:hypothetical protein